MSTMNNECHKPVTDKRVNNMPLTSEWARSCYKEEIFHFGVLKIDKNHNEKDSTDPFLNKYGNKDLIILSGW